MGRKVARDPWKGPVGCRLQRPGEEPFEWSRVDQTARPRTGDAARDQSESPSKDMRGQIRRPGLEYVLHPQVVPDLMEIFDTRAKTVLPRREIGGQNRARGHARQNPRREIRIARPEVTQQANLVGGARPAPTEHQREAGVAAKIASGRI